MLEGSAFPFLPICFKYTNNFLKSKKCYEKNDNFIHTYYINKKTQRPNNDGRGSSAGE